MFVLYFLALLDKVPDVVFALLLASRGLAKLAREMGVQHIQKILRKVQGHYDYETNMPSIRL